jgi:hypothetical protein
MDINTADNVAYITNTGNDNIIQCDIDNSGALINCIVANVPISNAPLGITITNDNSRVYISYFVPGGDVIVCDIVASGDLDNCIDAGATGLDFADDILLNSSNDKLYILNQVAAGYLIVCDVDSDTGLLSNCVDTNAITIGFPVGFNILQ